MTRYCSRTGKQAYRTRGEAQRVVARMRKRERSEMSVYFCTDCQGYHTTHHGYAHCKAIQQMAKKGIYDAWKGRERLLEIYEREPELRDRPRYLTKRQKYERSLRIPRPKTKKYKLDKNNYEQYDEKSIAQREWAYRRSHKHDDSGGS